METLKTVSHWQLITYMLTITLAACTSDSQPHTVTGYVEAELRWISAPQAGWITEQNVTKGDIIQPQMILFQLDQQQQIADVEQAKQNLLAAKALHDDLTKGARQEEIDSLTSQLEASEARKKLALSEWQRISSLVVKGLATSEQLEQAQTDLAVNNSQYKTLLTDINIARLGGRTDLIAQANAQINAAAAHLETQRYQLKQRTINSSMTGLVHTVHYHQGEFVTAGAPVLTVRLTDQDKVRFHVSQSQLPQLSLGQHVQVKADGENNWRPATINYISSTAEFTPPVIYSKDSRQKLVFLIEARLKSSNSLPPGLPVEVTW